MHACCNKSGNTKIYKEIWYLLYPRLLCFFNILYSSVDIFIHKCMVTLLHQCVYIDVIILYILLSYFQFCLFFFLEIYYTLAFHDNTCRATSLFLNNHLILKDLGSGYKWFLNQASLPFVTSEILYRFYQLVSVNLIHGMLKFFVVVVLFLFGKNMREDSLTFSSQIQF